jgi:hypothetical protein
MFDCHVVRAGDRAERSILTAQSKNEGDHTTPPPTKIEPLRLPPAVQAHTPAVTG